MKIQKFSLVVLAAAGLLAFSMPALADETNAPAAPATPPAGGRPGGPGGRGFTAEAQMERLTTELALTDAQKPKVKEVIDAQFKKMQEIRDSGASQEDRRAKMAPIREETTAKLKGILTEDQFKKYEGMAMGGRGGAGRRAPGAGASTNAPPQ